MEIKYDSPASLFGRPAEDTEPPARNPDGGRQLHQGSLGEMVTRALEYHSKGYVFLSIAAENGLLTFKEIEEIAARPDFPD